MPKQFQNSIMLGVGLESKNDVQGKLNELIKNLGNTKVNLDINIANSDVAKQLQTLTELATNFKSTLGGNISLGDIDNVINRTTIEMTNLSGTLQSISRTSLDGGLFKQIESMSTGLGETTKISGVVQQMGDEFKYVGETINTTTQNLKEYRTAMDNISKAQTQLNALESNGFVDTNKIADLRNALSQISSNPSGFSTGDLNGYLNEIKELTANESKIIDFSNKITTLKASLASLTDEKFGNVLDKSQFEQIVNQLNQAQSELKNFDGNNLNGLKQQFVDLNNVVSTFTAETIQAQKAEQESISLADKIASGREKVQTTNSNSAYSDLNKLLTEEYSLKQKLITAEGQYKEKLEESLSVNKSLQSSKSQDIKDNNLSNLQKEVDLENQRLKLEEQLGLAIAKNNESNSSGSFFSNMSDFLSKAGLFYGVGQVVQEITSQLKEASEYVETLDKTITNIQMITGNSKEDVIAVTNQFKELGSQLHITNKEMLAGSEELLRAGYDDSTTSKMLEASSMASKISGQTTQATTEQLIAMKNAFNMTGDQMQHVIDVISKLDNSSATSFSEISTAIMRTAYSAQQAGTSFDTLSSYVATVSSVTRRSAETIGESFRSVYSRYYNIKQGAVDEDGKTINDVEKALQKVGIKLRSSLGEFRDFDDVLNEFVDKYKQGTMNQVEFLNVVNALGGSRQKETLLSLVENFDQVKKHQDDLVNSAGSAKQMYDVYADSLEAKMNDLKRSFEGFYENILNSDVLKGGISVLTSLISTFGNIPSIVGIATTALMLWKGETIKTFALNSIAQINNFFVSFLSGLEAVTVGETTMGVVTNGLTVSLDALKTAFLSNPLGIVAVAITSAIALFDIFGNSTEKDTEKLNELNQAIEKNNTQIKSLQSLKDQYVELSNKTSLSTDESKKLQDIQNQLAQQCPELVDHYDALGNAYLKNADAIDQEVKKLKEKNAEEEKSKINIYDKQNSDARKSIQTNTNESKTDQTFVNSKLINKDPLGDSYVDKLQKANAEIRKQSELLETNAGHIRDSVSSYATLDSSLQKIIQSMSTNDLNSYKEGKISVTQYTDAIDNLSKKLSDGSINDAYTKYKDLTKAYSEGKAKVEDVKASYDTLHKALSDVGISESDFQKYMADGTDKISQQKKQTDDLTNSIDNLSKSYSSANDNLQFYNKLMEEYKNTGKVSYDTMDSIIGKHRELLPLLKDQSTFQKNLQDLISQTTKDRDDDIKKAINGSNEVTNTEKKNSDDTANTKINNADKTSQQEYLKAKESQEAKNSMYDEDVKNHADAGNQKVLTNNDIAGAINSANNALNEALTGGYNSDLNNFTEIWNEKGEVASNVLAQIGNMTAKIIGSNVGNDIANAFKSVADAINSGSGSNFNKVSVGGESYTPVGMGGQSYNSKDYEPKKSKSGSSSAKNQVENLEKLSDRYYQYNNALQAVNNQLDKYDKLIENTEGQEKIKLIQEKINWINKEKQAQQDLRGEQLRALSDLRNTLTSNNFTFNADGTIANANRRLDQLVNYANSKSGDDKKATEERVKKINEALKEYTKLLLTDLPKTNNEILNIKNTIISADKEIAEVLQKQRDDYIKNLQTETENTKKEIDKRKALYQEENEKEDYQDNLKKEQDKLNELQNNYQEALRTGNLSAIDDLKKQIIEQRKVIDDAVRDNERKNAEKMFDDQSNKLDEDTNAKIDEINKKLSDEQILKLVQSGVTDLQGTLNNITKATHGVTDAFANVGDSIKNSWLTPIDEALTKIKEIQTNINDISIGINKTVVPVVPSNNNNTPQQFTFAPNITIEGNASTETVQEIENMIDDKIDEFAKKFKH